MTKTAAIVEARMASTRLYGKVMLPILGKPMLQHMIERLRGSWLINDIIVATTDTSGEVVNLCKRTDTGWWIGSENDVLARVLAAARFFDVDVIVELTGDCPLIDPAMVDKVVADYHLGGADFVSNSMQYTAPRGMDVRVFSTDALAKVASLTDDPVDHEHVSLYMYEHPGEFRCRNVRTDHLEHAKDYRLTVDTVEDFNLVNAIFEELYPTNPEFTLFNVISLLDHCPELAQMNRNILQKAVR